MHHHLRYHQLSETGQSPALRRRHETWQSEKVRWREVRQSYLMDEPWASAMAPCQDQSEPSETVPLLASEKEHVKARRAALEPPMVPP